MELFDDRAIAAFNERLTELGYRFQFITIPGFHAITAPMFELAHNYVFEG